MNSLIKNLTSLFYHFHFVMSNHRCFNILHFAIYSMLTSLLNVLLCVLSVLVFFSALE